MNSALKLISVFRIWLLLINPFQPNHAGTHNKFAFLILKTENESLNVGNPPVCLPPWLKQTPKCHICWMTSWISVSVSPFPLVSSNSNNNDSSDDE